MVTHAATKAALQALASDLPDPFRSAPPLEAQAGNRPLQDVLGKSGLSATALLEFVAKSSDPSLIRVAVLVLTLSDAQEVYPALLRVLESADKARAEAFEPGLWQFPIPEDRIALDLVRTVQSTGNPNPLLLLQRDAARQVKDPLQRLIESGDATSGLYAMYCLGYALDPADGPFLEACSKQSDGPEMRALAGLYLLDLGSQSGLGGILAGLRSPDRTVRTTICYELSRRIAADSLAKTGYRPEDPPGESAAKAVALMAELAKREPEG